MDMHLSPVLSPTLSNEIISWMGTCFLLPKYQEFFVIFPISKQLLDRFVSYIYAAGQEIFMRQ